MSDYNNFDMSINEDRLLDAIREAEKYGLEPLVMINGLYYTVNMKEEKGGGKVKCGWQSY